MTFTLGAASRAHLVGVHQRLESVVIRAIYKSTQDFSVLEGLRSIEQQRENVRKGVSRTMASKHLKQPDGYGWAVDLGPWIDGRVQWLWGEPGDHDAAGNHVGGCYAVAAAMRSSAIDLNVTLRWGGQWDKHLRDLGETAADIRHAHLDYVAAFKKQHGRSPLCDGPHFELA